MIIIDEVLRKVSGGKRALPPLAVGMGMYLPASLTIMIPIGGMIGFSYNRWAAKQADPDRAVRFGTLAATGLIVGESLFGVVYAGIAGADGLGVTAGAAFHRRWFRAGRHRHRHRLLRGRDVDALPFRAQDYAGRGSRFGSEGSRVGR